MIAYILGATGQVRMVAEPRCGEDFCDGCGDCLRCYGDDWCPDGAHRWIVYDDQVTDWREQHPDATPWSPSVPAQEER